MFSFQNYFFISEPYTWIFNELIHSEIKMNSWEHVFAKRGRHFSEAIYSVWAIEEGNSGSTNSKKKKNSINFFDKVLSFGQYPIGITNF